ncbi:MAG: hypothetical protein RSB54_01465 [Bacilli bacterium]
MSGFVSVIKNNVMLILAITIFLIFFIIGFIGDLYLKKKKLYSDLETKTNTEPALYTAAPIETSELVPVVNVELKAQPVLGETVPVVTSEIDKSIIPDIQIGSNKPL